MSDERLRQLERRWQESHSPEDEAAYLRERLRAGNLERERLQLAAYLGHPGARLLMTEEPRPHRSLRAWINGIASRGREATEAFDREVAVRVALAAIEAALPIWETEGKLDCTVVRSLVADTKVWLRAPSHDAAQEMWYRLPAGTRGGWYNRERPLTWEAARRCAQSLVELLMHGDRVSALAVAGGIVDRTSAVIGVLEDHHRSATRAVVRAAVVPWLLGYGDSLAAEA